MTLNLSYGDKVSHLLNSNHIWAEFRDQKHDLFITDNNVRGYLTGKSAIQKNISFPFLFIFLEIFCIILKVWHRQLAI